MMTHFPHINIQLGILVLTSRVEIHKGIGSLRALSKYSVQFQRWEFIDVYVWHHAFLSHGKVFHAGVNLLVM